MKEMKCVHTRRVANLMKAFLNDACDLLTADGEVVEIMLHKCECFQADIVENQSEYDELDIYYNLDELFAESSKIFRAYWVERCPMLKGFSDVTISLLHELGHLETNDEIRPDFPVAMREIALMGIEERFDNDVDRNRMYFALPDEKAATEWAIKWLSDAENRKKAKTFEKKFFACFERA
jgi:hypothetical protein